MLSVLIVLAAAASVPMVNEANAIRLTNEAARYWDNVKPDQALASGLAAKQMWEDLGQTSRREYLVCLNNVITAQLLRGDLRETEPLVRNARELYLRTLPSDDPMLPISFMVLGTAYKALGNYSEARKIDEQALRMAEAQKAPASVVSKLKSGLGDILSMQGRLLDAQAILREALSMPSGESHSDIVNRAATFRSLGAVERHLGQFQAAEADDLKGLQLLENRHGQADVARGETLSELGVLAEQQNHWKQAADYLLEAVRTLEGVFGAGHPNLSPTYADLAGLYLQRNQYGKAETLYKRVLAAEMTAFPSQHPAIARDLNNLGSLAFKRRKFEAAATLFARASEMMDHTLGSSSADTGQVEANLANTLFELKRYPEARGHYLRALGILDNCWGEDDPRLLSILTGFAALSRADAEAAEAEKLETRMERIRVKQAIERERQQTMGNS